MKKSGNWLRTSAVFLLALLIMIMGITIEGITAYAATGNLGPPVVDKVYFKIERKPGDTLKTGRLIFEGNNLKNAEFKYLGEKFGINVRGYGKQVENFSHTASFDNIDPGLFTGDTFETKVYNDFQSTAVVVGANFTKSIPAIDSSISQSIFIGKDFEIFGTNLDPDLYSNTKSISYRVGDKAFNASEVTAVPDGTKITIPKDIFTPTTGVNQNLSIEINFNKFANAGFDTEAFISYTVGGLTIKKKFDNLDDMLIVPSKGYYEGGTILNIYAYDTNTKLPILNKNVFGDKMRVRLEKKIPGKPSIHAPTKFVGLKKVDGNNVTMVVETAKIKKEDIGKYDVIIYNEGDPIYPGQPEGGQGRLQEASKEQGFEYVNTNTEMTVANVEPGSTKDNETPLLRISGRDILNIDRIPMLNINGVATPTIITFMPDPMKGILDNEPPNANKDQNLLVKYKLPAGGAEYAGLKIESIYRKISVQIGDYTIPQERDIVATDPNITTPPNDTEPHFINTLSNNDKVIFRLKTSDPDANGKDVIVRTETFFKVLGWTTPVVYTGQAKWDKKFIIEPSKVIPVIDSFEPVYGYYNNRGALNLDQGESIDKAAMKPLLLRVKGKNFQVKRVSQGGEIKKVYPTIEVWNNEGQNAEEIKEGDKKVFGGSGEYSTKVLKVLKADGSEVTGQNQDIFGEIMLIQIAPENTKYELQPAMATTAAGGTYKLNANIVVRQDYGTNIQAVKEGKQKPFEFRYRNVKLDNEILKQPQILKVLRVGSGSQNTERVFLSDEESEVEIYFPSLDIATDKMKVTLDGVDLSKGGSFKAEKDPKNDRYSFIKTKLPKGFVGKTKLQLISVDGLIDSYDLEFQSSNRPLIANLIPAEGQAGTWVFLKGNPQGRLFDSDKEKGLLSKVLFNNKEIPAEIKDSKTIIFQVPTDAKAGEHEVRVVNANGAMSPAKIFKVLFDPGKEPEPFKLESLDPSRGDQKGGIPVTIKVKEGKLSKDDKVYFGSKLAKVDGTDLNFTKLYVTVPKFEDGISGQYGSYKVPVTVIKKSGVNDTLNNGFTYFNPIDGNQLKINEVYKKDVSPKTNKGNAGDEFWIEGDHFIAETTTNPSIQVIMPDIYFGYEKAEILEKYTPAEIGTSKLLPRILVKVPVQSSGLKTDGAVDVMIINPNGATYTKEAGFIYGKGSPQILSKDLEASRFDGRIKVEAGDVFKDPMVVFGTKVDVLDLGNREDKLITNHSQLEKVVVKYLGPGTSPNFEIYYQNPDGSLLLMSDATDGGKISMNDVGSKKIIKINWRNPLYHKNTKIVDNKELLNRLNDEYMLLETISEGGINKLQVRRGLGKVEKYTLNPVSNVATLLIATPYNEKIEKTTISIINTDGSSASAPFTFNDGLGGLEIMDIEGSKEREVPVSGTPIKAKVKTQDVTVDGVIKILGKNFKDITSVKIGGKEMKIESISPDYTYMIVSVPKGDLSQIGKPLSVDITSKNGNDFSDKKNPPIYFMYITAGSKPIIDSMLPENGPRTGGTLVKITGKGFREKDEFGIQDRITVTINGSSPAAVNKVEKNDKNEITGLQITMPSSTSGKAKLQVINADGGTSDPKDFAYISQPKITKVGDAIFFNDTTSQVQILGEDFQTGAKVIIGGELQKGGKKPEGARITGMLGVVGGINQDAYIIGGTEAVDVKVESAGLLKFKMPSGLEKLENNKIIIVNPDGGISDEAQGAVKPPLPEAPNVKATPGYERTMLLSWTIDKEKLNAAEKFEIYARKSGMDDYAFVGDTKDTQFIVKGLEFDTRYTFKVRVLNKYGAGQDVGEASAYTLRRNEDYKEKEKIAEAEKIVSDIERKGKREIVGDKLNYIVGYQETVIDLSNDRQVEKYIQIPVKEITGQNKVLTIIDRGMTLTVPYSSLNDSVVQRTAGGSFVRIKLSSSTKQLEESVKSSLPRNMNLNSRLYYIGAEVIDQKQLYPMSSFAGPITMSISLDRGRMGAGAGVYRYDEASNRMISSGGQTISTKTGGYYALLSQR